MKMFPGTLISRLKQMLTGGGSGPSAEGNDLPPVEEASQSKPLFAAANTAAYTTTTSLKQNGATYGGGFATSVANARRLSDNTDVPRTNQHGYGSHQIPTLHGSSRYRTALGGGGVTESRSPPTHRRSNNGPPSLIPIQYTTLRSSYGAGIASQQRGSTSGLSRGTHPSRPFASGLARDQCSEHVPTLVPLGMPSKRGDTGAVPELTSEFGNLLRSKYSTTPSTGSSTGYMTALDRDLLTQQETRKKYEALMKKFIPIAIDPQPRGAYDRFKRNCINGNVQRSAKVDPIEQLVLTDDEDDIEDRDTSDDCVEVAPEVGNSGRLFTTIDPAELSATEETKERPQEQSMLEPVNTVRERFQTKQAFRDNIIQDVKQRYGSLYSERKSLIEQEKERLSALKKHTQAQESELRSKMLNYVCSFYSFDVLDETQIKESTPEPEDVPLPELTKEQLEQMHRKLRTGNQLVIEKFNLPITGNDLVTLQGMNWLNDAVINFYMELLRERSELKRDQGLPKLYTMNTFFLQRLLQSGYSAVRRWTRKVDLLAHDMIVVPVHVGGIHWCMSTIDLRRKTIHYYDSMGGPNNEVLNALESYLCEESLDKRKQPFDKTGLTKQNVRDCPRQKNGSDCVLDELHVRSGLQASETVVATVPGSDFCYRRIQCNLFLKHLHEALGKAAKLHCRQYDDRALHPILQVANERGADADVERANTCPQRFDDDVHELGRVESVGDDFLCIDLRYRV
uniref:Ubiquitin-like protease family profile domain-containing protein n=1 Tax=Anopheles farauti TaxID=69004 RepID=A0A182QGN0_9DIPT